MSSESFLTGITVFSFDGCICWLTVAVVVVVGGGGGGGGGVLVVIATAAADDDHVAVRICLNCSLIAVGMVHMALAAAI